MAKEGRSSINMNGRKKHKTSELILINIDPSPPTPAWIHAPIPFRLKGAGGEWVNDEIRIDKSCGDELECTYTANI